ncbi:MAG: hypothetical protein WC510_08215 [Candidatus Omnitrophota bacterium]
MIPRRLPYIFIYSLIVFFNPFSSAFGQAVKEPVPALEAGNKTVEYTAAGTRDPFQAEKIQEVSGNGSPAQAQAGEKPLPSFVIQGIVWGDNFPQAIINNKVLKVGDTIEEARIVTIDRNGIIVMFNKRQYNLSSPASGQLKADKQEAPKGGKK